jgi:hypothetical protein
LALVPRWDPRSETEERNKKIYNKGSRDKKEREIREGSECGMKEAAPRGA